MKKRTTKAVVSSAQLSQTSSQTRRETSRLNFFVGRRASGFHAHSSSDSLNAGLEHVVLLPCARLFFFALASGQAAQNIDTLMFELDAPDGAVSRESLLLRLRGNDCFCCSHVWIGCRRAECV